MTLKDTNNINRVMTALLEQMQWNVLKLHLQYLQLPTGIGGENTRQLVLEHVKKNGIGKNSYDYLLGLYEEAILTGEKITIFYEVDKKVAKKFISKVNSISINDNSPFKKAYPYHLSNLDLGKVGSAHELVRAIRDKDSVFLTYCAKRSTTDKMDVSLSNLKEPQQSKYFGCEIVAVKKTENHVFDTIAIYPDDGLVQLRIDNRKKFQAEDIENAIEELIGQTNQISRTLCKDDLISSQAINLFPLIDAFYHSNEGRVCELSFTTLEGSVKNERMRTDDLDLRKESFHVGGTNAVNGEITPYRLAIRWDYKGSKIESTPELLLPGSFRASLQRQPVLKELMVSRVSGTEAYNFIIGKVHDYLDKE